MIDYSKQSVRKRIRGFTLIELMIVVVIVAILAAIAYPSYTRHVQKGRQTEAQGQIMSFASSLEAHRAANFSYKGATLSELGPDLDASNHYNVVLVVAGNNQSYTITATPKGMMSGTDVLTYDSSGTTSW